VALAGVPEPKKELRAESIRWLEPGKAHYGYTEAMLVAMLMVNLGASVAELG
jgi:hypothetical protein